MVQEIDLWGDPVPEKAETRGRPMHQATSDKRLRVAVLRGLAWSSDAIAQAMGISERTLRTYYLPELKGGLSQKRAEMLVTLWKKGHDGNVSAMKEFLRQTAQHDLVGAAVRASPKPPRRGKKEQAIIDAGIPDTNSSLGELMARRAADTADAASGGSVH